MSDSPLIVNGANEITVSRGNANNRTTPESILASLNAADPTQTDLVQIVPKMFRLNKPIHIAGFFDANGSTYICDDSNLIIARSGANWVDGIFINGEPSLGSTYIVTNITGPSSRQGVFNGIDIVQDTTGTFLQWYDVTYDLRTSGNTITLLKSSLASGEVLYVNFLSALQGTTLPNVRYTIPIPANTTPRAEIKFTQVVPRIGTISSAFRTNGLVDNLVITACPTVEIQMTALESTIYGLTIYGQTNLVPIAIAGGTQAFELVIRDISGPNANDITFTSDPLFSGIRIDRTVLINGTLPNNPNITFDTTGVATSIIDSQDATASPYNYSYNPAVAVPVTRGATAADASTFTINPVLQGVVSYDSSGVRTTRLLPRLRLRKYSYLESEVIIHIDTGIIPEVHDVSLCVDDAIEISLADTGIRFGVTIGSGTISVTPAFSGSLIGFYALIHSEYAEQQNINIPLGVRRFGQRYVFSAVVSFIANATVLGVGETIDLFGDFTVSSGATISTYVRYIDTIPGGAMLGLSSFRIATNADDSIYYQIFSGSNAPVVNTSGPIENNLGASLGPFSLTLALGRADLGNVFLVPLDDDFDLRVVRVDSAIAVIRSTIPNEPIELFPTYSVIPSLGGLTLNELTTFINGRQGTWTFVVGTSVHFLTITDAGDITARDIALSLQSIVYNSPSDFMEHPFNYTPGLLDMPNVRLILNGSTSINDPTERINVSAFLFQFSFLAHITTNSGLSYFILRVSNIGDNTLHYVNADLSTNVLPNRISSSVDASPTPIDVVGATLLLSGNTDYTIVITSPTKRPRRIEYNTASEFVIMETLDNEPNDINFPLDTSALYDSNILSDTVIQTSNLEVTTPTGIDHTLAIGVDSTNPLLISAAESRKIFYDIKQSFHYLLYYLLNGQHGESIMIGENTISISGLVVISRDPIPTTLNNLQFEIGLVTDIDRNILTPRKSNNLRVEFIPSFGFESGRSIALNVGAVLTENQVLTIRSFIELKDI